VVAGTDAPTPDNPNADAMVALSPRAGALRGARAFDDLPGTWTVHGWREGDTLVERIDVAALEDVFLICHHRLGS